MYHIVNPNTLYDVVNELKIELGLYHDKEKYDIARFLDDVSVWMDNHRPKIGEEFLPFSVLSVGIIPIQVSAFLYGLFVGRALERHGLKIKSVSTKVDKGEILKEIQKNLDYYNDKMGDDFKKKFKEFGDNNGKTQDT